MKNLIKYRKRTARNILFLFLFFAVVMSFANFDATAQIFRSIRYFNAPVVETIDELNEALDSKKAAKINVIYLADSGIYYGTDKSTSSVYTVTQFDDKYLSLLQEGNVSSLRLFDDGTPQTLLVTRVSSSNNKKALKMLIEDYAGYAETDNTTAETFFYDQPLRLEGIRSNVNIVFILSGSILAIGFAVFLYLNHRALNDITKYLSPEEMDLIDEESQHPLFQTKLLVLTEHYLIRTSGIKLSSQLLQNKDIIWMYRKVTSHRMYGFIPAGTSTSLMVYTAAVKEPIEIQFSEQQFNEFVESFQLLGLKTVIGYNDALFALWRRTKNKDDFWNALYEDETTDE